MKKTKVLILGGAGMLGHTLFYHLSKNAALEVTASTRNFDLCSRYFSPQLCSKLTPNLDADRPATIEAYLNASQPDVAVNCIGLIKQIQNQQSPAAMIAINAVLPHQLANFCSQTHTRLIHVSTDCVFSGNQGNYRETDPPDPKDLYGITKQLGEISYPNCLTLRTSIIGHELRGKYGLVEWFLSQSGLVKGYTKAIYSGFPTIELARFIETYVLPNQKLEGLLQLSANPISKYELLNLIKQRYAKSTPIEPDAQVKCARNLDSALLRKLTGYQPPSWSDLIDQMFQNYWENPAYHHAAQKEELSDVTV
jgi:dTDP-4-dehydrorhamnose reductase